MTDQLTVAGRRRSRTVLGLVFVAAGVNHFVMPRPYRQIVPPWTGRWAGADTIVAVSGVAELAGGWACWRGPPVASPGCGLIALLAAVFPANLHMALNPEEFRRIPRWALYRAAAAPAADDVVGLACHTL